jgi:uncharacterized protein with HEPN domain
MKRSAENNIYHLQDMLDWALEAQEQVRGETRISFESDRRLQLALMKILETIGEAASKVTSEFRMDNPQIPWAKIIGMRNRLIHAYREVVLYVIWDTALVDIPILVAELKRILEDEAR